MRNWNPQNIFDMSAPPMDASDIGFLASDSLMETEESATMDY